MVVLRALTAAATLTVELVPVGTIVVKVKVVDVTPAIVVAVEILIVVEWK